MSVDALDSLIAAQETLLRALDGDEAQAIDDALGDFRNALEAIRAIGGWRDTPGVVARITQALQLAEAARARINYLADRTRRRLDRLASLGVQTPGRLAYGRDGRIRA